MEHRRFCGTHPVRGKERSVGGESVGGVKHELTMDDWKAAPSTMEVDASSRRVLVRVLWGAYIRPAIKQHSNGSIETYTHGGAEIACGRAATNCPETKRPTLSNSFMIAGAVRYVFAGG